MTATGDEMTRSRPRILGSHEGSRPGPLMIVVAALHGNEPAGVEAAERVLRRLATGAIPFRGRLVALVGNRTALAATERYVDCDLNRVWGPAIPAGAAPEAVEAREQAELATAIEAEIAAGPANRSVILLDLHSTSADGAPFSILADTLRNRRIAMALPIPAILGLEENIEGTLLEWFCERGHAAVCVEGGRHGAPDTPAHHEAALWIVLATVGLVAPADFPELDAHRRRLAAAAAGAPRVVEVTHRHAVDPDEPFTVEPGFLNFMPVDESTVLAHAGPDLAREIRPPFPGLLLMPRYQLKGDDGYFLAARVHPFWLTLSAWLRRLHLETLLPLLPGVRRTGASRRSLDVNRRVARFLSTELFHLFGYRRRREIGDVVRFTRRVERA